MPVDCSASTAYLGLGSNLGDRRATLRSAVSMLDGQVIHVDRDGGIASLYETSPVGGPAGQSDFFNSCVRVETTLDPQALWQEIRRIEDAHGRRRIDRWGPRTLDIDLLLFGELVVQDERLSLPHPSIPDRGFVLEPLAELAANFVHPGLGTTIGELAARWRAGRREERVVRVEGPEWAASTGG